jgi:hypothetical protein
VDGDGDEIGGRWEVGWVSGRGSGRKYGGSSRQRELCLQWCTLLSLG